MKKEDKKLLIKDLCVRLPYGVKVHAKYTDLGETIEVDGIVKMVDVDEFVGIEIMYDTSSSYICVDIEDVKPYLFPLSSMTEEQKTSHNFLKHSAHANPIKLIDWYIKNHFDYRGLIPMGLANDATGLNIY